MIRFSINYY